MYRMPGLWKWGAKISFSQSRSGGVEDRCRRLIKDLSETSLVPSPFDIDEMILRLAKHRQRPVHLEEIEGEQASYLLPCAVLIQTVTSDHIMYTPGVTPLHREHIIAHEIGHLIFDHGEGVSSTDLGMVLMPNIDPRLIKRMLGRASYSSKEEREAETFASLLVGGGRRLSPVSDRLGLEPEQAVAQVEQAWGDLRRSMR